MLYFRVFKTPTRFGRSYELCIGVKKKILKEGDKMFKGISISIRSPFLLRIKFRNPIHFYIEK